MKIEVTTMELVNLIYQLKVMHEVETEEPKKDAAEPDKLADAVGAVIKEQVEVVEKKAKENKPKEKKSRQRIDRGKVKALRDGGWAVDEIANEMSCSPQTIRNIYTELDEREVPA